jgi:two-component system, chemotaxis family, protein-glutamate methylesterase/glutaminase
MAARDRPASSSPAEAESLEILVVDDSALVRQRLKSIIESDSRFRVVVAADPYEAVAMLSKSVPGVIVLDVEMPRMDGLTFLRKLMRQHPLPVVLCTAQAERAVTALEMGALEVIAKPDWNNATRLSEWSNALLESIRNAARAGRVPFREDRVSAATDPRHTADAVLPKIAYSPRAGLAEHVVAVGVSTGGVQALQQLLAEFPATAPGIVIVQHMPLEFTGAFATRLDNDSRIEIEVAEARQHEPVRAGRALIIPGDTHGVLRR